jgi:hypothetical protein
LKRGFVVEVIPVKTGIQNQNRESRIKKDWIPAFASAGMATFKEPSGRLSISKS